MVYSNIKLVEIIEVVPFEIEGLRASKVAAKNHASVDKCWTRLIYKGRNM